MRASNLREINTSAVLEAAVRGDGGSSRADIASTLGLTRPTVSAIVEDLLRAGLLREEAPISSGTGRPRIPLSTTDAVTGLGAEIAADRIRVVARSLGGAAVAAAESSVDLTSRAPAEVARLLEELVARTLHGLPADSQPVGLVVSVPGRLSEDGSEVVSAPNLGWTDLALLELLEERPLLADLSPRLANDADLAARHEVAARPGESFLFLHGETGLGGAVVLDGTILRGDHGWAGEFGHVTVVADGAPCRCGRRGCLEAYAGFHALRGAMGLPEGTGIDELVDALASDDPAAHELLERVGGHLGRVVAGAANVLDVSTVVLSGYLQVLVEQLSPALREVLEVRALRPGVVVAGASGAGRHEADGAAWVALEAFWSDVTGWMHRLSRS